MKKVISLLLVFAIVFAFAACGTTNNEDETTTEAPYQSVSMRVAGLAGPTGIGMVNLMKSQDDKTAKNDYTFSVVSDPTEIVAGMTNSSYDIAACPINLAATLYNKLQGNIQVLSVNTKGVLYILENGNTINSVEDLEGKTIYSAGQGAVPEYALKYILDSMGVNCTIKFESEHDVVSSQIISGAADIVLLPEPKVTATLKNEKAPENLRIALDLNDLWEEACKKNGDDSTLYMGCIIVNKKWAEEHKDEYGVFLMEYYNSVNTVNSNPDAASQMIANHGIIPKAPLAKAAIPNANIVCITGEEMSKGLTGFYKILHKYNPASVGGEIPGEEFYK